jgi:hypothetical protein
MVTTRLAKDKKSRGGSTQKSYCGMNLAFPFKNSWLRLGPAEEDAPSSAELQKSAAHYQCGSADTLTQNLQKAF